MPEPLLLAELGAVVVGLAILARIAGRLGLSPIPFYLLAGLAFGEGGLAPLFTAEEFITMGANIGVILLLLLLGLEYSADDLLGNLRTGGPVGALNLVLNFTPGFLAGLLLGWGVPASLFLGGVTYPTSSSVMAKLMTDGAGWGTARRPRSSPSRSWRTSRASRSAARCSAGPTKPCSSASSGSDWRSRGSRRRSRSPPPWVRSSSGSPSRDRRPTGPGLLMPLRDFFAAVFFIFFGFQIDPSSILPVLGVALVLGVVTMGTKVGDRMGERRVGGDRDEGTVEGRRADDGPR